MYVRVFKPPAFRPSLVERWAWGLYACNGWTWDCKVCNDLGVCCVLHTTTRQALPGLHKCQRVRTDGWIFTLLRLGVEPRPLDLQSNTLADSPSHVTPASCPRHQMSERNWWLLVFNAQSTLLGYIRAMQKGDQQIGSRRR